MQHITYAPHPALRMRQPQLAQNPTADDGRWEALDQLTEAREAIGLGVDDILVLRALLTFLPKGDFHLGDANKIVFPSNHTLAARCAGMEERTLRRHVVRLESLGLIARRLSPSKKRFACRDHTGHILAAYGIDLTPLIAALPAIAEAVAAVRQDRALVQILHTRIRDCLYQLTTGCDLPANRITTDEERGLRNMLRRKPVIADLQTTLQALELRLAVENRQNAGVVASLLSDRNGQNVRHIQSSEKETKESETAIADAGFEKAAEKPLPQEPQQTSRTECAEDTISLSHCQSALREGLSFANSPVENWGDLVRLSTSLAPMIGIPRDALATAIRVMGQIKASVTVLAIIEMQSRIKAPGAYLRALCLKAERQEFSISRMIRAIESQRGRLAFPAGNRA